MSANEHPKEDKEEWITAAGALALLKDTMPSGATFAICARANDGMIRARAERFMRGKQISEDVEVPAEFWWARGHAALQQNWKTGDFETWINQLLHLRAYGVSFLRSHIEKMIARAHRGGRVGKHRSDGRLDWRAANPTTSPRRASPEKLRVGG
jgi:hypothetical protein